MEFLQFCRVCLQESEEMYSIFVPQDITNNTTLMIYEKIMFCSSVKITHEENLPDNICSTCLKELDIAYKFQLKVDESDKILKSFMTTNSSTTLTKSDNYPLENSNINTVNDNKIKIEENNDGYIESFLEFDENCKDETNEININNDHLFIEPIDVPNFNIKDQLPVETDNKLDNNQMNSLEYDTSEYEYLSVVDNDEPDDDKIGLENFIVLKDSDVLTYKKSNVKKPKTQENTDKQHSCEICGNKYKYNHSLQTHLRRHRNERPFSCELCGKAFVLNVELKTHMRTHTGLKPYPCRYCDRRFSDFGSRGKHERTHTGERPYVCNECGKAFAYSYGLSGHMLIHTGEKPFGCEKCGKHFNKKHHLKNHLNMHIKNDGKTFNQNSSKDKYKTLINTNPSEMFEEIVEEMVSVELSEEDSGIKYYVVHEV